MTREDILAITPEDTEGQSKLNQIIAEFMGVCWHDPQPNTPMYNAVYTCTKCKETWSDRIVFFYPNYCHSLDLMHEVEMSLMAKDWHERYLRRLLLTSQYLFEGLLVFTTALEKAKAAAITILETKGA